MYIKKKINKFVYYFVEIYLLNGIFMKCSLISAVIVKIHVV